MQKRLLSMFIIPIMVAFVSISFSSCKGVKDSDLQTSIETALKADPDLSSLAVTVKDGVATIAGECKDDALKAKCEELAKGIKGVKNVINNCTITPPPPTPAPVEIAVDDPLMKAVADATKDFPTVKAAVKDGVITLTGEIKKANLSKLMMVLNTLKPKKIENQLTIK
ncbi:MAG: BON domain-containing protein [Chitinophagaceae bacterium]